MKKILILLILLPIMVNIYAADNISPLNRQLQNSHAFTTGGINLNFSNLGTFQRSDDNHCFEYPVGGNTDYIFKAGLWVGGKKIRRNSEGEILYWLHFPPQNDNDFVTQSSPEWNSDLTVVVDTLTSIAFDGDLDLYEFLPAYNPLEYNFYSDSQLQNYDNDLITDFLGAPGNNDNDQDGSTDEDEFGRSFQYPDNLGTYIFNYPFDDDNDGVCDEDPYLNGALNEKAIYYDFSPFGNNIQRDWGSSKGSSDHQPLNIAIEDETYSWPILELSNFIIKKYKIHNCGVDPIYDLAVSFYNDAEIQNFPNYTSNQDDVSSFDIDNNFAFSYDADGDDGNSTGILGVKLISESENLNYNCYSWLVGDGPDDFSPLSTNIYPTANEKYWLQTGRNPNTEDFVSLKDFPDTQIDNPCETRYLYTIFGDQNGADNQTENSINLAVGESKTFYLIMAIDETIPNLETSIQTAENIISNGFEYSEYENSPSIPVIRNAYSIESGIHLDWLCFTQPDEFKIWKKLNSSSDWESIDIPYNNSEYNLELPEENLYDIKVSALYGDVYLESQVITIASNIVQNNDVSQLHKLGYLQQNYPNPFNPTTTISFSISNASKVNLAIYNIKNQKIKTLTNEYWTKGKHSIIWNGKDNNNKNVASGVYFYKLQVNGKTEAVRKCLLLK